MRWNGRAGPCPKSRSEGAAGRHGHLPPLSWRAQKCAVSQELGRNLFYKPSMQVYRCIEGSDRVIVELSRQFFQNRLDLRVLVQGRLTHHGREQIAREEAAIVPQNDQVRLENPPVSRKRRPQHQTLAEKRCKLLRAPSRRHYQLQTRIRRS